jgi:hypothetical protein
MSSRANAPRALASACLLATGCRAVLDLDGLSFDREDLGAAGASASGGSGGAAGGGGTGGAPLASRGLLARYFIDEAPTGSAPALLDAATNPLPLELTLDPGGAGLLGFEEPAPGRRALRWKEPGRPGDARAAIPGTKLAALDGASALTLEVVYQADTLNIQSPLATVPSADKKHNQLSLWHVTDGTQKHWLGFYWNDERLAGAWGPFTAPLPRRVVHLVLDTTQPWRVRLFIDAEPAPPSAGTPRATVVAPAAGEEVDLGADPLLVVGNWPNGDWSLAGRLHYIAYYLVALDDAEIALNAAALFASDDGP